MNKRAIIFITGILLCTFSFALPKRPSPPRLVNDLASVFTQQQDYGLEEKLRDFSNRTTTQIVVVTLSSLDNYPVEEAATEIGQKWGVGGKEFDNGIVILFKPKTNGSRGQVFIATGYGMEAIVPDATAKRIIENEMIPRFEKNDIYGGINAAVNVLMKLSLKEYTAKDYDKKISRKDGYKGGIITLLILLFIFFRLFASSGRIRRSSMGSGSLPLWLLLSMLGSGSNRNSGGFGNFSSGGGAFGGGSSFGGFGGGGFGGGGAGGSW